MSEELEAGAGASVFSDPVSRGELAPLSWRAEWPWALIAPVVAVLARLPVIRHHEAFLDADNGLVPQMARRIADPRVDYWPLMCDGQDYLGALDAYIAAPFMARWPTSATGFCYSQQLVLALLLLLLYPLLYRLGGRLGAVGGALVVAVGTYNQQMLTVLPPIGYLTNVLFGVALLHVGLWTAPRPTPGRLFALGLLAGLGWWNSPQVATFVAAPAAALLVTGRLFTLQAAGEANGALWRRPALLALLAIGALGLSATALASTLLDADSQVALLGYTVSFGRPEQYLPRAIVAAAAAVIVAELWLATSTARWIRGAAALGVGGALGAAPLLAHFALGRDTGVSAKMRFSLERVHYELEPVWREASRVVLGTMRGHEKDPLDADLYTAYVPLHAVVLGLGAAALLALLWRHGRATLALARGYRRPLPTVVYALLPGAALLALGLIRGEVQRRYFLTLMVPLAALVAWGLGGLTRRLRGSRGRALAIAALIVVLAHALVGVVMLHRVLPRLHQPEHRQVLERLRALGVTSALANYWPAVRLNVIGAERPGIGIEFDHADNLFRFVDLKRAGEAAPAPVYVYDERGTDEDGWRLRDRLLREWGRSHVAKRWSAGPYTVVHTRRR